MSRRGVASALAADAVLVTAFATVGRTTHGEDPVLGLWTTAWPFLLALAVGWAVTRAWRAPTAPVRAGIPIAVVTVAGGMLLRALSGQGTAAPFIIVASVVILAALVGWRLIATTVIRRRSARQVSPASGAAHSRELGDGAVLRPARAGDEPGILALIHALAVYEREPDAVENTPEMIHATLFGPEPRAFAHVVEREGAIVGIAIWFLTYSTWTGTHGIWLEDLYVDEAQRGRGYGRALMSALAAVCLARGYRRFEWTVLDWNEPSIGFYRSIGAEPLAEWTTQRLTGAPLEALARA